MPLLPTQSELLKQFSSFLIEAGLSSVSVKNYLSDLRHFLSYCSTIVIASPAVAGRGNLTPHEQSQSTEKIFSDISKHIKLYTDYQKSLFTPTATTNRRLASIRRFSTFLQAKYSLSPDQSISSATIIPTSPLTTEKILSQFRSSLEKEKKTHSTVKNYLSDLNHFFSWTANQTPFTTQNLTSVLSESQLSAYVTYLKLSQIGSSVINRRQSSIKKLAKFCFSENYIRENPFEIKILSPKLSPLAWLERFRKPGTLSKSKNETPNKFATFYHRYNSLPFTPYLHLAILVLATSAMVVFGYNQIIKQAKPSSATLALNPPKRQLSFQGRLTDSSGTPITTAVNVIFKLWNAPTGGTQLYTSNTCSMTPDQDGIFNTLIGDGVCGAEINASVFSDNRDVYLELTVGTETLTPRQQIATVGYALNSETLQGYPASSAATANTVPVIDNSGNINIAVTSPSIISTSGTFNIIGQSVSLQTATNSGGDIILQPDALGSGQILGLSGTTSEDSFRITNANLTTGALISGYIGNNTATGELLSLSSGSTETDRFSVFANGQTTINTSTATNNKSALIINQNGTGNLISASSSGDTRFTVSNGGSIDTAGNIVVHGLTQLGDDASDSIDFQGRVLQDSDLIPITTTGTNDLGSASLPWDNVYATVFTQNGNLVCDAAGNNCPAIGNQGGKWQEANGALSPINETWDILFGGQATASAKFAFTGVNSGTPTASISGTTANVNTFITGNGNLAVTNMADLTLGGSTTGNVIASSPFRGSTINATSGIYTGSGTGTQRIDSSGNLTNIGTTQINSITYTWPGSQSSGQVLTTDGSGVLTWNDPTTLTASTNYWNQANGTLFPKNSTVDVLFGGQATASAKFAFTGVNSGTPTASISGTTANVATYLTGEGNLATTNMAHLTIGGSTTGGIDFNTTITSGTWNGSTIAANYGGTGFSSYTVGDLLYANSTSTLAKLADVATGNVLISGGVGTAPSWGKVVLGTHTTGNYVSTVTGTANQITTSAATGDITLSVPSDFRAPGTVNAVSGIYTGAGAGTQRVDASGNLTNIGTTQINSITYTWPGSQSSNYVLQTNGSGTLSWVDPNTVSASTIYWNQANGTLFPKNSTVDVLFGGQATASAKFAFTGVNSGTPTASISGTTANVATYLTGEGNLATTNMASLTLGGSSTGDINIGTGSNADTIHIGEGGTNANTITIGSDAVANTITIGNTSATTVSITDNNWNITTAGAANFVSVGATTPGTGAFTTLTSSGNSTLGTGSSTTNTLGAGASSVNTIGSTTTPGALTLHGATTLDNTFTVSGSNLTTLGADLYVGSGISTFSTAVSDGTVEADKFCTADGEGASDCISDFSSIIAGAGYWSRSAGNLYPTTLNDTISATTSASVALTLTQTGAFNALLVQDEAGDTTPFVIDQSGNVGIGTTGPDRALHISTTSTNNQLRLERTGTSAGTSALYANSLFALGITAGSGTGTGILTLGQTGGLSLGTYYGTDPGAGSLILPGNVGIGTTSPQNKLNVFTGASAAVGVQIGTNTDSFYSFLGGNNLDFNRAAASYISQVNTSGSLRIGVGAISGNAEGLTLINGGSVGIGDTTPDAPLDVVGDVYISDGLSLFETAVSDGTVEADKFCTADGEGASDCISDFSSIIAGAGYWSRSAGNLYPTTLNDTISATTSASVALTLTQTGAFNAFLVQDEAGDTTPFVIDQSGNVGIGTTAPGTMLSVVSSSSSTNPAISSINDSAVQTNLYTGRSGNAAISGKTVLENASANALLLNPSGGSVGIGDTTPAYLLTVGSGDLFGVQSDGSLIWEGSGADAFETTLSVVNPTADVNYRLADAAAGTYDICTSASNCGASGIADDSLDFTEFTDTMSLDADTSIAAGAGEELTYNKTYTNATSENGFVMSFTASDTTSGTTAQYGLALANAASTEGLDAMIYLNNLDTDDAVASGILIQSAAGTITTAIDATDAEIATALSVGANDIIGTIGLINYTNFDVASTGNITTAGDIAVDGGDITANGDLTINPTGGDVNLGSSDNLGITAATNLIFGGTTSLGETTSAVDSGAFLVGTFDEFTNSASTTVQGVLNDLDAALASGGAGSMWTLASGVIYPTSATNDFAIGGTTLAASIFSIDESTGTFLFGGDQSANPTLTFEATDSDTGDFGFNTNDAFYFSGANVGIGDTSPLYLLTVGSGDLFQVDSSGNTKAPTLALGTATIAPTDRTLNLVDSTAIGSTAQYGAVISQTFTGTATANHTLYGTQMNTTLDATDGTFALSSFAGYAQNTMSTGNTTDNLYGFRGIAQNNSTTLSPDTANTASASAGLLGTALNNAAGTVSNQYGSLNQSYTNVDGAVVTSSIGTYGASFENVTHTTGGIVSGFGGYFVGQDGNTSYGLYAQGIQNTAGETFTNLYGVQSECQTNNATVTVTNCYGVRGNIVETLGTITNGYAGYFSSANALASAYGVYANVTGASTTNYGVYSNVSGATTNYAGIFAGGNVGIGDTTPASLLTVGSGDLFQVNSSGIIAAIDGVAHTIDDVGGNLTLTSNSTAVSITDHLLPSADATYDLGNATTSWNNIYLNNGIYDASGTQAISLVASNYRLTGGQWNATTTFRIGDTTNTMPGGTELYIEGDASMSGTLTVGNGDTIRPEFGPLSLAYKSAANTWTTGITLQDTTGNVGIGTAAPNEKLEVAGALGNVDGIRMSYSSDPRYYNNLYNSWNGGSVPGNYMTFNIGTGTVNTTTEVMRLVGNGNVGIGDTTPDALLDLDAATTTTAAFGITDTGVHTGTGTSSVVSIVANSTSTGNILHVVGTGLTTGEVLNIDANYAPTSGPTGAAIDINLTNNSTTLANDFSGINLTIADSSSLGNTVYGLNNTITLTGNVAKFGYGIFETITSSSTTGDNLTAGYFGVTSTGALGGATTRDVYGIQSYPVNTGANSSVSSAVNVYGGYFSPQSFGPTTGTTKVYGGYFTTLATHAANAGTINQYGVYVANDATATTNGTSTKYGINLEPMTAADENIALCFDCDAAFGTLTAASGIQFGNHATNTNNLQIIRTNADGAVAQITIQDEAGTDIMNGSTGTFQINLTDADEPERLCHSGADGATGVVSLGDCAVSGADYAEYFGSDGTLEAGDVVVLNGDSQTYQDPKNGFIVKSFVKKSYTANQTHVIGIVSTHPYSEVLGERTFASEENKVPVALAGQVPVKVSTENGPIEQGDYLTTSSIPGVAMKATQPGTMLGKALQAYDKSEIGSIITLINVSYADPEVALQNNNNILLAGNPIDGYTVSTPNGITTKVGAFASATVANFKAGIAVVNNLVADNITIRTKLISPIADIDQLKVIDATVSGTLYADNIKGQTVDKINSELDLLDEKYSTASAILADLQAKYTSYDSLLGSFSTATVSADPLALSPLATTSAVIPSDLALNSLNVHTLISNDILANGAIFTKSLNSFDTDLFIQPGGDKPVHLLASLMTLYPDGHVVITGDLILTGTLYAQTIDTQVATISSTLAVGSIASSGSATFGNLTTDGLIIASGNNTGDASTSGQVNSNTTIGTATIATGSSEIVIASNKVTDTTLVYITPTSDTQNQVLYVKSKQSGIGFTVAIPSPLTTEVKFNYWLVQTK